MMADNPHRGAGGIDREKKRDREGRREKRRTERGREVGRHLYGGLVGRCFCWRNIVKYFTANRPSELPTFLWPKNKKEKEQTVKNSEERRRKPFRSSPQ